MIALLSVAWGGVIDIAAAENVGCALDEKGVACWGYLYGLQGQQAGDAEAPTRIDGPPGLTAVETDGYRLYGIDRKRQLWTWRPDSEPQRVHDDVVEVEVSAYSVCVRTTPGQARCWFENETLEGEPVWKLDGVADVEAGVSLQCALTRDGRAVCSRPPDGSEKKEFARAADATGIAVDASSACLLRRGGPPICSDTLERPLADRPALRATTGWSDSRWGWCWVEDSGETACELQAGGPPVVVRVPAPAPDDLVMGEDFACGRWQDEVRCWGDAASTWLGVPGEWRGPLVVPDLVDVVDLAVGRYGTCAQTRQGEAVCWGPGLAERRTLPSKGLVPDTEGGPWVRTADGARNPTDDEAREAGDVRAIANGCVLADGVLRSPNEYACNGAQGQRATLLAGEYDGLCFWNGRQVQCAGQGDRGAWGNGRMGPDPGMYTVPGLGRVTRLASRDGATCALDEAGIACWGLGALAPFSVAIPDPVDVAVGGEGLMCAATAAGEVWCRITEPKGYLLEGYLGIGRLPARLAGLSDVVQIGLGVDHGCTRHRDGTVRCFGRPSGDRLGDGGTLVKEPRVIALP